jgi:SPP1 gp7 family putative phage head morphogenesis protein
MQTQELILHKVTPAKYDPTHTTALRNAFAREFKVRFTELKKVIRQTVNEKDCFGLKDRKVGSYQLNPPLGFRTFAFLSDPKKIEAFMLWLHQQVEKGLLTLVQFQQIGSAVYDAWTNRYIADSYKRGIIRARYELNKAGITVPTIDESGGIDAVFNTPFHLERVGILYIRVYSELTGITAAMETTISQILAQGMIDGDGPALIARKLVAAIDGTGAGTLGITDRLGRFIPAQRRAMLLARTEIIRAHHLAMVQEYRNWGLEGVSVLAEWATAGDDRVCPKCAVLEGKIFTLDEVEPLIPLHPQCRCVILPYIEDLEKYYNN